MILYLLFFLLGQKEEATFAENALPTSIDGSNFRRPPSSVEVGGNGSAFLLQLYPLFSLLFLHNEVCISLLFQISSACSQCQLLPGGLAWRQLTQARHCIEKLALAFCFRSQNLICLYLELCCVVASVWMLCLLCCQVIYRSWYPPLTLDQDLFALSSLPLFSSL